MAAVQIQLFSVVFPLQSCFLLSFLVFYASVLTCAISQVPVQVLAKFTKFKIYMYFQVIYSVPNLAKLRYYIVHVVPWYSTRGRVDR